MVAMMIIIIIIITIDYLIFNIQNKLQVVYATMGWQNTSKLSDCLLLDKNTLLHTSGNTIQV